MSYMEKKGSGFPPELAPGRGETMASPLLFTWYIRLDQDWKNPIPQNLKTRLYVG